MKVKFKIVKVCQPESYPYKNDIINYSFGIKKKGLFGWKYLYQNVTFGTAFQYGIIGGFKSRRYAQLYLLTQYGRRKPYEVKEWKEKEDIYIWE